MAGEQENTEISQVTLDNQAVAELLGIATGENVITQTTEKKSFTRDTDEPLDAAALEKEIADDKKKAADTVKAEADKKAAELLAVDKDKDKSAADIIAEAQNEDTEEEKKKKGRPEFQKGGLQQLMSELIKEEKFVALDDPKPMEEWTKDDYKEFIELNLAHREDKVKEEIPVAFFDSLPEEFQTAFVYLENLKGAKGGYTAQDVHHILRVVTQVADTTNLDVETEEGQEAIVRNYLQMRDNSSPEELDEEIASLKDKEELEKKAKQFKPKLDSAQQQRIEQNVKRVEQARRNAEAGAAEYMDNVFNTLAPKVLGGLKLDDKTQKGLYHALVLPKFTDMNGRQANEMAYLLESKQFGKNRDLETVALVAWILKDKEGFLAKAREQGATAKVTETVKKLKIEQASRNASTTEDDDDAAAGRTVKTLKRRDPVNPFKRD
jgi:hypothetical protein